MPYATVEQLRAYRQRTHRRLMAERNPTYLAKRKRHDDRRKARRRELHAARMRRRYAARDPVYLARIRAHNLRNQARHAAALTDKYIRHLLNQHHGGSRPWPPEIIELKRAQVRLKRALREREKKN